MRSYTNRRTDYGIFSNNTTAANLALGDRIMNDSDKYLISRFNLNEATDSSRTTVANQQNYLQPYNIDKMIDVYVTIGANRYKLTEVPSRDMWDRLNYTTFASNIPTHWFDFAGQTQIYPTPSASGSVITHVYKTRVKDLSAADYVTGTVSITTNTTVVTGVGTTFTAAMVGRWIQVTAGDNQWYQIGTFTSTTVIGLANAYAGATIATSAFTIGEMSLLSEIYQNIPIYYACMVYYSSRVNDMNIHNMYKQLYDDGVKIMNLDLVNKTENMVIDDGSGIQRIVNPNLYITL